MGARSVLVSASAEKVGEQRNQRNADQGYAAACHELFNALTFRSRIVVAVTFQKVDCAPNGKARAEGDYEGLKNADCGMKETHNVPPILILKIKKAAILRLSANGIYKCLSFSYLHPATVLSGGSLQAKKRRLWIYEYQSKSR
jgi:hypothetical protein